MNLYTLKSLTQLDYDNLADIAWFIRGLNYSEKTPFCEDHEKTIEHVLGGLRNKLNDEKELIETQTKHA